MQNQKTRTTRNSQKVQKFWEQEVLYHQVLQNSLKPSVLMADQTGETGTGVKTPEHANNGGQAEEPNPAQRNQAGKDDQNLDDGLKHKGKKPRKTIKQHLISDSESDSEVTEINQGRNKKQRVISDFVGEGGSQQNGGFKPFIHDDQVKGRSKSTIPAETKTQQAEFQGYPNPSYAEFLEYKKFVALSQQHSRQMWEMNEQDKFGTLMNLRRTAMTAAMSNTLHGRRRWSVTPQTAKPSSRGMGHPRLRCLRLCLPRCQTPRETRRD